MSRQELAHPEKTYFATVFGSEARRPLWEEADGREPPKNDALMEFNFEKGRLLLA
jgi:hypothetical protein